jgi:glycerophosphoryl diester phosphodiesterase
MVKVCAHRGARKHFPENTRPAIQKAIQLGVDMIEIDVRRTKDNLVVLSHDADLGRVFNKSGLVQDLTYSDISIYRTKRPANIPVPLLSDVLEDISHSSVILNIELKSPEIEESCIDLVNKYGVMHQVVYSCFQLPILTKLKALEPSARICCLSGKFPPEKLPGRINDAQQIHAEYMNMHYSTINPLSIQAVANAGMKIMAWTVDSAWRMRRLIHWGIDTIITNNPEKLIKIIR